MTIVFVSFSNSFGWFNQNHNILGHQPTLLQSEIDTNTINRRKIDIGITSVVGTIWQLILVFLVLQKYNIKDQNLNPVSDYVAGCFPKS